MKYTIVLMLLLITISCTSSQSNEQTDADQREVSLANTVSVDTLKNNPEDFAIFFEKFRQDSLFQKSRIRFPLSSQFVDFDQQKGEYFDNTKQLTCGEWKFQKLEYNSETEEKQLSAFTTSLQVVGDTAEYLMRGVNNGIHNTYHFVLQNDQWYLTQTIDGSM